MADPDEIDSLLDGDEELDPQVQAALDQAAHLPVEELPPLQGDEPLGAVVAAYVDRSAPGRPRTPEPSLANARLDPNASVFLEAWGEERFLASAYYRGWASEWEHQLLKERLSAETKAKAAKEK